MEAFSIAGCDMMGTLTHHVVVRRLTDAILAYLRTSQDRVDWLKGEIRAKITGMLGKPCALLSGNWGTSSSLADSFNHG